MKSRGHLFYNTFIFVILWLVIDKIPFSAILLPIAISTFPDVDLHFESHRNMVFHSVIIWAFICWRNFNLICTLAMLSIGLHLLLDIRVNRLKWRGFYTIKIYRSKSLFFFTKGFRGRLTTVWLFSNFLISIVPITLKLISL